MRSWKRLSSTRWMRTETTCRRPRPRFCTRFSKFEKILRVWSSTDSGSATDGFSNSTGPMPEMKPQPSAHASGGADMLEQAADALRHLELAVLRREMIGLHIRHGGTAAEIGERLWIVEQPWRWDPHDRLVGIGSDARTFVEAGYRRNLALLHRSNCCGNRS